MPAKISLNDFQAMLEDPDVSDKEIAEYLRANPQGGGAFAPEFVPDSDLVGPDPVTGETAENAMSIGNWWCRRRRRTRFQARVRKGEKLPVLVSEGDSWFQFPFLIEDVIDQLGSDHLIWSCGAAGDTAQNMIFDAPEYLTALDEQAESVQAFLFSAAGNDVLGEDANGVPALMALLHKRTKTRKTAESLVNKAELTRVLDRLKEGYLRVITSIREDSRFAKLPILVHGYDYAFPYPEGDKDPRRPKYAARDGWLGKPMVEKGITDPQLRRDVIRILVQGLYDMLAELAAADPHVHVVDVRDTLANVGDWNDEIHGTSEGYARVADKFREVLRQVGVGAARASSPEMDMPVSQSFDAIESPGLSIEKWDAEGVSAASLGFGDISKFANGFRRTSAIISGGAVPELAIGADDSVPYRFLMQGAERGRAVCRIKAQGRNFRGQLGSWSGTGFLVAPNILLTNHHVINAPEVAAEAQAVFDYYEKVPGVIAPTSVFTLDPARLFLSSPFEELDYCFVWVNGAPHETFGTIDFWRGSFMGAKGSFANVIHHPQGMPKRTSIKNNEIIELGLEEVLVHYTSDTEPGSSGAPVLNSDWRLFALHHASTGHLSPELQKRALDAGYDVKVLNEGIKTSAIAIDIETRASKGPDRAMARKIVPYIAGTDSRTGYFGTLGRDGAGGGGMEVVVDSYRGGAGDIDVAFWNVEWFNRDYQAKSADVARIVADLNLDIWAFEETSPQATEALVQTLRHEFDMDFAYAASEPNAPGGRQTTCVIWNKLTVKGTRLDWPADVDAMLRLHSDDPQAARFEAEDGKIFDRYPGLFQFEALNLDPDHPAFRFNLVPLHLKAMSEGAKRRRMASNLLAEVIAKMQAEGKLDPDWILGGDFNAELSTGQFDGLKTAGFTAMSAADERGGAITYLGQRYLSLIDSIFLSPGLTPGTTGDDFMIVALDRADPGFINRVSDHRPVMIRLRIADKVNDSVAPPNADAGAQDLARQLDKAYDDLPAALERLAELLRKKY